MKSRFDGRLFEALCVCVCVCVICMVTEKAKGYRYDDDYDATNTIDRQEAMYGNDETIHRPT